MPAEVWAILGHYNSAIEKHFAMTVVRFPKAGADINVIKFWEYQPIRHRKILYQEQLSML